MRIHDTLEPLTRAPGELKALMAAPHAFMGDGGYARVLAASPARVVKLTSCAATIALLDALCVETRAQRRPAALPAVFRRYGPVAVDADGVQFHGYELERLFAPGQTEAMRIARVCRDETDATRRTETPARHVAQSRQRFAQLRARFEQHQARCIRGEREPWRECQALAGALASERDAFGTEDTFAWLERFVGRHQVELDLLNRGNLLMSAWATPVLADPVAVQALAPARSESASQPGSAFAVLVERVQGCQGLEAQVRWHTEGPFETLSAAHERRDALLAPDADVVRVEVTEWRSSTHRERMHEHPVRHVPIWALPRGAGRALNRKIRAKVRSL